MPKKQDPSFDDEFQDDESLSGYDDEDISDDSESDGEDYDEDYDEEYDEDYDDEESPKGSWVKKALFATIGVGVVAAGAYFVINNFLPASKPTADNGPYANPGGLGKVAQASPAADATTGVAAASPSPAATEAPQVAEEPVVTPEPVQATVAPVAKVDLPKPKRQKIAKRWTPKQPAKRWVAKKPVMKTSQVSKVAAAPRAAGNGHFTLQVGAFSQLANAETLVKTLNAKGIPARMSGGGGGGTVSSTGYLVRSTVVDSKAKANQLVSTFAKSGHPSMLVAAGNGKYSVQLGAFSTRERAQALTTELKQKGMFVSITPSTTTRQRRGGGLTKVFAGDYPTLEAAQAAMRQLRAQNIPAVVAR